ncbi:hypothetical protein FXO37_31986 [Capsicum annuum]|nr:hypothetical protein FXO37_31986 [Capsicum annuum]
MAQEMSLSTDHLSQIKYGREVVYSTDSGPLLSGPASEERSELETNQLWASFCSKIWGSPSSTGCPNPTIPQAPSSLSLEIMEKEKNLEDLRESNRDMESILASLKFP